MSDLSSKRDLQWSIYAQQRATDRARLRPHNQISATADLLPIIAICAFALLATIIVMLRFPDLGALIASYNQF